MADWILQPFESLGPVTLGAGRADVRAELGEPGEFFKGDDPNPVDVFDVVGVHAYYDDEGRLEFLETFDPCRPVYAEIHLLGPDAAIVVTRLAGLGLVGRDDGDGTIWYDEHGFALYTPENAVEGVSVFRRGYATGA